MERREIRFVAETLDVEVSNARSLEFYHVANEIAVKFI